MADIPTFPAPWYWLANSWQYSTIYDADDKPICRLDLEDWGVTEDNQADLEVEQARIAHIISAAPEMVRTLHQLLERFRVLDHADQAVRDAASAAIAKARGIDPYGIA